MIIRSDIPPLFSRNRSSCYVLRNWSQRRWRLKNARTVQKTNIQTTLPPSLASSLSPHPQRKVQRVPCVWAQRSKWYSFMSQHSAIVTPQHTNTHCCPARVVHSAHWPSASPSVLGMTHKRHTVQTQKIQICSCNPGDKSLRSNLRLRRQFTRYYATIKITSMFQSSHERNHKSSAFNYSNNVIFVRNLCLNKQKKYCNKSVSWLSGTFIMF